MSTRTIVFLNIIIPLAIGGGIYFCVRPDAYFSKYICEIIGYSQEISLARPYGLRRIIQYYLCDALWAYSLTWTVAAFLGRKERIKAFLISVSFCIIMECLQLFTVWPGSFDVVDIIVEIIVCLMAIIIFEKVVDKEEDYEKSN